MAPVPATHKAYRYESFGQIEKVLKLVEVKTALLPASHVRIQVHSVALNPVDFKIAESNRLIFTSKPPSAEEPYSTGFDVAGVVVEVGSEAKDTFQIGDEVYAMPGVSQFGSLTEYFAVDTQFVTHKPKSHDFDHAAAVPLASLTSYQALTQHTKTQAGERVLILGGSSGTGIFAVQYAKALGAHVIATTSAKNVAFVKSLGADQVIDYTSEKWTELLEDHSVDVIYDTVGELNAWNVGAQHILKKQTGRFVTIVSRGLTPDDAKFGATYTSILTNPNAHDLSEITTLIEAGKIKVHIDSVFAFDKAVDAFSRIKTGRAVGKIVIKVL